MDASEEEEAVSVGKGAQEAIGWDPSPSDLDQEWRQLTEADDSMAGLDAAYQRETAEQNRRALVWAVRKMVEEDDEDDEDNEEEDEDADDNEDDDDADKDEEHDDDEVANSR